MTQRTLKIYSSSAGSGKTFTLAKSYLQLVITNPLLFRSILAVTFTNKAAWEMKSRILEYLFQLSTGLDCPVLQDLITDTDFPEGKIRENASQALTNILHNYPLFSVKTIDSFFQGVVQAFAKELGLQGGFEIELDQEKVLDDLVDRVMLDVGTNQTLTKWLIRYSENRVNEGKSWDIKEDIKKLAWEIFNENFKAFEADIQQNGHVVPELLKALGQIIVRFEKALKELGIEGIRIARAHNLQVNHFSYGKTGVMGYMEKISLGNVLTPGLRMHSALTNPDILFKNGDPNKEIILMAYENGLKDMIGKVVNLFKVEYPDYTTATAISRYIYTLGILSDISLKLRNYREENQTLLISDLADFLKKIIQENDAPFIYEKTGTRYRHFMIDEFQDTSGFQWDNFKPLIKNSLAEGHLNLVVGDVKQSIYRWRGGNWELMLRQIHDDINPESIEKLNLDTNHRSKRTLIQFYNALFMNAPPIFQAYFMDAVSSVNTPLRDLIVPEIQKFSLAYKDALQLIPKAGMDEEDEGYVKMVFFEDTEEQPWEDQALDALPGILEKIQDAGYSLKDIAFLVRNKNEGERIISFLMQHKISEKARTGYRYDAISSESLFLSSAHSVRILLQALEYLNYPENEIALFNIVFEYQLFVRKNRDFLNPDVITQSKKTAFIQEHQLLPGRFLTERRQLASLPFYEMVETLIRMFDLNLQKGEWAFIQAFLDQVLAFTQKERGEIDRFLEWWQKNGSNCSIQMPDEVDAAQVLTIHKSKGLQFKVVIIPFCSWELDHNPTFDNIIWCESDKPPFNLLKRLPVKYANALSDTLFGREYFEEKINSAIDNLNLLYVAATRARDQLIISSYMPVKNSKGDMPFKSISDLLLRVVSHPIIPEPSEKYQFLNLTTHWDAVEGIFEAGSMGVKKFPVHEKDKSSLTSFISADWRKRISIKFSSRDYVDEPGIREGKIKFGKLVHRVLAQIKTYSELPRILKEFYYEGIIDGEELKTLGEKLEMIFKNDQLMEWFSGSYMIKAEKPVLLPGGSVLRPDRIMIKGDRAVALDFKTGKSNTSDHRQVHEYMLLLKEMGYRQVDGYLLYLNDLEIVKVKNL